MSAAAAAGQEVNPAMAAAAAEVEEWAECACCGLREECTPTYAAGVRARYGGRWLCGLCGEAGKPAMVLTISLARIQKGGRSLAGTDGKSSKVRWGRWSDNQPCRDADLHMLYNEPQNHP
uniref:Uncharacterized protein n=1 Tax=Leersia perrieri TaxID=77586 RepID=A0A0D9VQ89_9ORYZ